MRAINRCMHASPVAALTLCTLLAFPATANSQTPGVAYNRTGLLTSGNLCITWDDDQSESWVLSGPAAFQIPFDVEVRIIGIATLGADPDCAITMGRIVVSSVLPVAPDVGIDFCFGDGGNQAGCTSCPCTNNAPAGSTGGCLNSAGQSTELTTSGSASLVDEELCFGMVNGIPGSFSILISGTQVAPNNPLHPCFTLSPGSGTTATAFDGLRCTIANTARHGGRAVDTNGEVGSQSPGWGFCSSSVPNSSLFIAGQTRYFQAIYREDELAICMSGLNTTQGTGVTFTP